MHLLLLLAPLVFADPTPAIRLPDLKPIPQPMPGPDTVARLSPATLYVVDGDTDYLLLASPKGIVTTVTEAGPLKVRGQFADGNGKVETRTFRGKTVTFVEASHSGRVELLIVPKGAATESDVIRRTLDVDAGEGPQPPPGPTPTPDPKPDGTSPFPAAGFRVLIVFETGQTIPPGQHSAIYGKAVREYLETKCVVGPDGKTKEYRIYDKDTDATAEAKTWQDAMKLPRQSVPWLYVGNGKSGFSGPLPGTVAETLTLLKKYGGE